MSESIRKVHAAEIPSEGFNAISDRVLSRLYSYWSERRRGRHMPPRSILDPGEMRFALGYLVLLDVIRPQLNFRVRLQGTELERWIGGDFTGKMIDALPEGEHRTLALELLKASVLSCGPIYKVGQCEIGGIVRRYEAVVLPMSLSNSGADETTPDTVSMLLAGIRCQSSLVKEA